MSTEFPLPPPYRRVVLFTALYIIVASFFSLQASNWEFIFYIGVLIIIGVIVLFTYQRLALSKGLLWFLSIWGLLHVIGGLAPSIPGFPIEGTKHVLYSMWIIPGLLKYDHLVHAYGFGMATWVCWQGLKTALRITEPRPGIVLLCVLGGMGLGALNEVVEFIATLFIQDHNVGGYVNTGWDLVSNLLGSATAGLLIWGVRPKHLSNSA